MSTINNDIYNMRSAIDDLKKEFIEEESADVLELSTYGFLSAVLAKTATSTIKVAAELGNEMFPDKARLEGNIITHAVMAGITDINANPASMSVLLCIDEKDLTELFTTQGNSTVTIDSWCPFIVGDYEYHLDYPIIITKNTLANNKSVYTARYDMSIPNKLSNIENPYLPSPYIIKYNATSYLELACDIRQVMPIKKSNKLITSSSIDNKTYEFTFEEQLADFYIEVIEGDVKTIITPLLEGQSPDNILKWCWYSFLDSNTIRVKFDADSYVPGINAEVNTIIKTTMGEECSFEYNSNILATLSDTEKFNYKASQIVIIPQTASAGGRDRYTTTKLRKLVAKEGSSRGNLTSSNDLNNYFNKLNSSTLVLDFKEKVYNQAMMQFYGYVLAKDSDNNVVPTNTIDLMIKESDLEHVSYDQNDMLICKQGYVFGYNYGDTYAKPINEADIANYDFVYSLPFKGIIDKNVPNISYYVSMMNNRYKTYFEYINEEAPLQFICASAKWTRGYQGADKDNYRLNFEILQNIFNDEKIVIEGEDDVPNNSLNSPIPSRPDNIIEDLTGNGLDTFTKYDFTDGEGTASDDEENTGKSVNNLLCIVVCYKEGLPFRYFISNMSSYDLTSYTYTHEAFFSTNDIVDSNNNVRIEGGYAAGLNIEEAGYFEPNTSAKIYILCRFLDENNTPVSYGRYNLDSIVKLDIADYTVTNVYSIIGGLKFYDNFSDTISTIVTTANVDGEPGYRLFSAPLIRYDYGKDETKLLSFIDKLKQEKTHIDEALKILENPFTIDIKFYNTYGAARGYTLDAEGRNKLDRVNISPSFRVSLKKASDDYTIEYIKRDIKDYFESIEDTNIDHHIPNLISYLYSKYSNSVEYIEYRGINGYNTEYQHLYAPKDTEISRIPEFINIHQINANEPDITIRQV